MDLKVTLDVIPEYMEKLTIKQGNQRCLRDNLCIPVRRENSGCALMSTEKYSLHVESM